MDREFVFENLPDVVLRLVLKELSLGDIGSVRCTSKRMESRVTSIIRSKVNTFYIPNIDESNCVETSESLAIAMSKDYAPKKLEFKFAVQLNEVMNQMLLDYKNKVTSLDFQVWGNEEFLLKPSTVFESLESMTLYGILANDVNVGVAVCENMLAKHAHNLSKLRILDLNRNLLVPTLPKIDSLTLSDVCDETAWNLYKQSRKTLTILDIYRTNIKSPSLNNEDSFKITNLKHLTVMYSKGIQFVLCNADNISSLCLRCVEDITEDIEWPHFPRLRELYTEDDYVLPILQKNKDTLERLSLSLEDITIDDIKAYVVEMPKLTDLYFDETEIEEGFLEKILRCNHKSLEFLYLRWCNISNIDVSIKMERVKKVVIKPKDEFKEFREILSMICPNAEVVLISAENSDEIRGHVESRQQAKGFSMDTEAL